MNKKLLFGIMSLAALAACTNDDFDSQQQVAEGTSPVQFEVVNNDASMRASMDGDAVKFSATDGDLFTLYHGAAAGALTGYQNATYTSSNGEGAAVLTTPSVILPGSAIMVWPADTTFSIKSTDNLSFSIPADQPEDIENYIPYASDLIQIAAYADYNAAPANAYNKAGKDRKYPVYMRTMASLLKLKADYAGTDETLASLYTGEDKIDPIKVTSVQLITKSSGATEFTTKIPVTFTAASPADNTRWNTTAASKVPNNAWSHVTGVDRTAAVATSATLTTECLDGNSGCKFIILPQPVMSTVAEGMTDDGKGVLDGGVVVNTIYGKVVIQDPAVTGTETKYTAPEIAGAWYRYVSAATAADEGETKSGTPEASGDYAGKYKVTSKPEFGLQQTLNAFGKSTAGSSKPTVEGEYCGAVTTRFVKVLLTHLDMSDLHIENDKQLRDAARVWQKMGLPSVTVYLDGDDPTDANGKFEISQKTIKVINDINAAVAGKDFKVKPCNTAKEVCKEIVITGADTDANIQDLSFILVNGGHKADVVLKAGESWNWSATAVGPKKAVIVDATATGVQSIINKGTLTNGATATLAVYDNASPAVQVATIPFRNEGTWNVTSGDLNVQFDVTNVGTVNISSGAEYHQDGTGNNFTNEAVTLPQRFLAAGTETVGKVVNKGVLACVNSGKINNYGVIRHDDPNAKTYITSNMSLNTDGFTADATFGTAFNPTTSGAGNKMGWIILPYSNKDEENVSISNATANGFVSVEISTTAGAPANGKLDLSAVGAYVNYCIIKGGVTEISAVAAAIKYVEFDAGTTEIAWKVATATYDGLVVFSPVNVQRGTTITVNNSAFLKAKMYVGGSTTLTKVMCNGYFGDTRSNFDTMYLTY